MSIEVNGLNELENDVSRLLDAYKSEVPAELQGLAALIRADLQSGRFKNDTNKLRSSIRVTLIDNSLSISMLDYGYYQSFGVNGKKVKGAIGLPNEVATRFGVREGQKFTGSKIYGISPKRFYPLDIEDKLIEILTQEL